MVLCNYFWFGVSLSWIYSLERKHFVWRSAILVIHGRCVYDGWPPNQMFPLQWKYSGQPHTKQKIHQQTNKTIRQTREWQQPLNPHNLELIRGNYIRAVLQLATDPFITSTCTQDDARLDWNMCWYIIKGRWRANTNRRCTQTSKSGMQT
jgi:hypothetical protein